MSNIINQRIKAIRKSKGISQKEVAKNIGLTVSGYSKMENGGNISYDRIVKLAEFFCVSKEFIIDGEESRSPVLALSDVINSENSFKLPVVEPFTTSHEEQELIKVLREISIKNGSKDYFNSILIEVKSKRDKDNAK